MADAMTMIPARGAGMSFDEVANPHPAVGGNSIAKFIEEMRRRKEGKSAYDVPTKFPGVPLKEGAPGAKLRLEGPDPNIARAAERAHELATDTSSAARVPPTSLEELRRKFDAMSGRTNDRYSPEATAMAVNNAKLRNLDNGIRAIGTMTPEERRAAILNIRPASIPADVRLNEAKAAALRAESNDLARRGNLENYATNAAFPVVSDRAKMILGMKGAPVQYGFPDSAAPGLMRVTDDSSAPSENAMRTLKALAGGTNRGNADLRAQRATSLPATADARANLRGAPQNMMRNQALGLGADTGPLVPAKEVGEEPNPGMDFKQWQMQKYAAKTPEDAAAIARDVAATEAAKRAAAAADRNPKFSAYLSGLTSDAAERRHNRIDRAMGAASGMTPAEYSLFKQFRDAGNQDSGDLDSPTGSQLLNQARAAQALGNHALANLLTQHATALMENEAADAENRRQDRKLDLAEASMLEDARKNVQAEHPEYDENQVEIEARRRLGIKKALDLPATPSSVEAASSVAPEAMPISKAQGIVDRLHNHPTLVGLGINPDTTGNDVAKLLLRRSKGPAALDHKTLSLLGQYANARQRVDPEFAPSRYNGATAMYRALLQGGQNLPKALQDAEQKYRDDMAETRTEFAPSFW